MSMLDSGQRSLSETSFRAFLDSHLEQEMLRFTTAGSVDDGKSTLIGRLLHDTKSVYEDQLASIRASRVNRSGGAVDLSLLTDGLKAEREQGITIDVAYRYFSTAKRKFIIADTPGHEQYTRNMATGASTADVAIVLIDAKAFQRAGSCCRSRGGIPILLACCGFRMWLRPSTRWTLWNIARRSSRRFRAEFAALGDSAWAEEC